jgi:hypothetical protein
MGLRYVTLTLGIVLSFLAALRVAFAALTAAAAVFDWVGGYHLLP